MKFDFDTPIPLKGTHSMKWDGAQKFTAAEGEDIIPMWVADMDFAPPAAVTEALQAEVDRNTYGYFGDDSTTRAAIADWMADKHDWQISPDWLHFTNGVVHGFSIILEAFSKPGDGVLLFTPVYHAFARKIAAKGRDLVQCPLSLRDGIYHMDLEAAQKAITPNTKIVVHCSPHNPGGRIWSVEETAELAEFAAKNDLILISDEIHQDLTFPGESHSMTARAAPSSEDRLITITAASKGFNLAGGETGFMITQNDALRDELSKSVMSHGGTPNRFGMLMTEAAFRHGSEWSHAVRHYIADNFRLFKSRVDAIPGLACMDMKSTYLAWVDFSPTGMALPEFSERVGKAGIAVNAGPSFGMGGENFLRFNVAMPKSLVEKACDRLENAFSDLQ